MIITNLYKQLMFALNIVTFLLIIVYLVSLMVNRINKKKKIKFIKKPGVLLMLTGTFILILGNIYEYFCFDELSGIYLNVLFNIFFFKLLKKCFYIENDHSY